MKGFVKLVNDDINILSSAYEFVDGYKPEVVTKEYKSWFRTAMREEWKETPSWYGFRYELLRQLDGLMTLLWRGNEVVLTILAWGEIIKLSKCDINANPYHILNNY